MSTLVQLARRRSYFQPQRRVYTFLDFRAEAKETHLTYGQLDAQARAVALHLSLQLQRGDRAVLLYRPGLEFISGFLGCLYAGVVAVPVNVAQFGRGKERLQKIVADCGALAILSTRSLKPGVESLLGTENGLKWICSDELETGTSADWDGPDAAAEDLAFLQYSSGSTGDPKGIMISHGNLMHQAAAFGGASGETEDSCFVSWLPTFHDMGLIAGVLQPLFGGYSGVLLSPEAFGENPYLWLKAISDYWADISAAPNFAYDMCVRRITPEQVRTLDLSRWRVAINGAEPVRARTINEFSAKFAECGFERNAFHPAFGLAEATLVVTGGGHSEGPTERCFSSKDIEQNRVTEIDGESTPGRTLVGCGLPMPGQTVAIVDPETGLAADALKVGEIWVSSGSVGGGYWNSPEQSEEIFEARLPMREEKYLRTGDLGFFYQRELFVCGRLKDLILIRGRNHHSPDIELTVEGCHAALRPSCGAAFSVDFDDEERLVVVHEIDRKFKISDPAVFDEILTAIQAAVTAEHEIQVHSVVLVRHGTIAKTSSGKIQRRKVRNQYLEGKLRVRASWGAAFPGQTRTETSLNALKAESDGSAEKRVAEREIEQWLIKEVAKRSGRSPEAIDVRQRFEDAGIAGESRLPFIRLIEKRFQCMLASTLIEEFPAIDELARYLAMSGMTMSSDAKTSTADGIALAFANQPPIQTLHEPIAIIGLGCRFPGAEGPRQFWKNLCEGVDAITEVPADRWDVDEVYDPNPMTTGKINTRSGGFLKNIDQMDRRFFGLSIREAVRVDPQHRLMLEVAWEALEDAGLVPDDLAGRAAGVFVGISGSDYAQMQFSDPSMSDAYAGLGCALTIAASRISHFLNLRGPAIAVDTACSSSLTAVHLACASLRQGECTLALAGGVNVILSPLTAMSLSMAGMMSPDGRCKAFDASANGYVRSEGAGIVVLKPLSRALADGDPVYAVIRGSASNQDGHSSGIAAPNGEAQQAVILAACRDAGIAPGQLNYVEAHGTGTPVGDPIEVKALGTVLAIDRPAEDICVIGSVKTNIGHSESAAGVASLIKTALILKHGLIPPSLHFKNPNPLIPFESLPLRVQTTLGPLPRRTDPSLAGVNGFGVGGTNVHIVLEEAPRGAMAEENADEAAQGRTFLLPLSAGSSASLQSSAQATEDMLRRPAEMGSLPGICYTASVRRGHLEHRLAVTGRSSIEVADALAAFREQGYHPSVAAGFAPGAVTTKAKLAFIFSGQGSQWWGMGLDLLRREPVFQRVIEECDALFHRHTGWSLIDGLKAPQSRSRLEETEFAQPAIFGIQVGLSALLRSWGVIPDAVAGHSAGELAAAHTAGALTLEDAIYLTATRAALMQKATGLGKMASVELSRSELEPMLADWDDRISIAGVNSPASVVLSGESTALQSILDTLRSQGVITVQLPVNYAFHSAQMEPFKEQLIEALGKLKPSALKVPMFSTVTGKWCDPQSLDGRYWGANMRQPVLLAAAIEGLARDGVQIFMEIGPHAVLSGAISRNLKYLGSRATVIQSLQRDESEQGALMRAVGSLYTQGYAVEWKAMYARARVCQTMPSYRWDRQRFWLDEQRTVKPADAHPLLGARQGMAQPIWQNKLDLHAFPFLSDFRVKSQSFLPSGALVELALAALSQSSGAVSQQLSEIRFEAPAGIAENAVAPVVQVTVCAEPEGETVIRVFTRAGDSAEEKTDWNLHLTARTRNRYPNEPPTPKPLLLDELRSDCREHSDGADLYSKLDESGIHYGQSLRVIDHVWRGDGQALFTMTAREPLSTTLDQYRISPDVLEGASQACLVVYGSQSGNLELAGLQRVRVIGTCQEHFHVHVRLRSSPEPGEKLPRCDVWIAGDSGEITAVLEGAEFKARDEEVRAGVQIDPAKWLYRIEWQEATRGNGRAGAWQSQGSWIIFNDDREVGSRLAAQLRSKGERCVTVGHGDEFAELTSESFVISPSSPQEMQRLLAEALPSRKAPCRGIIYLWSLDSTPPGRTTQASIDRDQTLSVIGITHLIQAITLSGFHRTPRLWCVTGGAQRVPGDTQPLSLSEAGVWGLGKVVAIEHPELRCSRIDISEAGTQEEVSALFEECWSNDREDQVLFRGEQRYVARLERDVPEKDVPASGEAEQVSAELAIADGALFRIGLKEPGNLDTLAAMHAARRPIAAGEIEIRVLAAGLDSRDVNPLQKTKAAGEAQWIGDECSGTVVRLGSDVMGFEVGEEVIALTPGCLTPYLTVSALAVVHKPAKLSHEEAATTPRAFLAAYHALRELARLASGEYVLIHMAGSSLGLAAVEVAKWLGATAVATAESDLEREFLLGMGVRHIFDAHALSFPSEILKLTHGKGVDVILNCMPEWNISQCLHSLGSSGRVVDVAQSQSGSGANTTHRIQFSDNFSFHTVDLEQLRKERPVYIRELLIEVLGHLQDGRFTALPVRSFPVARSGDALRYVGRPKDPGRVAVLLPATTQLSVPEPRPLYRPDATYLITGGLGGLGLSIAQRMVQGGARHLVLLGRRDPTSAAQEVLAKLREEGAECRVISIDVGDAEQMGNLLSTISGSMPPLRGIIHAAGILANNRIVNMDEACFRSVMPSKVTGAWHLHTLTAGMELDFFVLFSSLASLIGSPGQANYAVANAFLDGLAESRKSLGLPGLSIGWGPWAEVGMAADAHNLARLAELGMGMLVPEKAMDLLDRLIEERRAGTVGAIAMNWQLWSQAFPLASDAPFVTNLIPGRNERAAASGDLLTALILEGLEPEIRVQRLKEVIHKTVCQSLQLEPASLSMEMSLSAVGLDSIVAMELKSRLEAVVDVVVHTPNLLKGPTVHQLATQFVEQMLATPEDQLFNAPISEDVSLHADVSLQLDLEANDAGKLLAEMDNLSDAQVSELLSSMVTIET